MNQILSSKIGNVIIENYCKSYVTNKKKGQKKLKFDLINLQLYYRKF